MSIILLISPLCPKWILLHRILQKECERAKGQIGDPIAITTHDDVGILGVEVTLTTVDGTIIEKGQAVEAKAFSGNWVYTATVQVASGSDIFIEAEGFDRAGNRAVSLANPIVGSQ